MIILPLDTNLTIFFLKKIIESIFLHVGLSFHIQWLILKIIVEIV
jgi:hypothetical protein